MKNKKKLTAIILKYKLYIIYEKKYQEINAHKPNHPRKQKKNRNYEK